VALAAAGSCIYCFVTDVAPSGLANEHNVQGDGCDPSGTGKTVWSMQIEAAGGQAYRRRSAMSAGKADSLHLFDTVLSRYTAGSISWVNRRRATWRGP